MTSDVSNNVGYARQRSFSLQPPSTPICQQLSHNGYVAFYFSVFFFSPLSILKDMLKHRDLDRLKTLDP